MKRRSSPTRGTSCARLSWPEQSRSCRAGKDLRLASTIRVTSRPPRPSRALDFGLISTTASNGVMLLLPLVSKLLMEATIREEMTSRARSGHHAAFEWSGSEGPSRDRIYCGVDSTGVSWTPC